MNEPLKNLLNYYIISALIAGLFLTGAVLSNNYRKSLLETYTRLDQARINIAKIKNELLNIRAASVAVKSESSASAPSTAAEYRILLTLDNLNAKMKASEVTVTQFEVKDQAVQLPVSIKGSVTDYPRFLNDIGALQALNGPFFFIDQISLSGERGDKGGMASYEIKGTLKMIATQAGGAG